MNKKRRLPKLINRHDFFRSFFRSFKRMSDRIRYGYCDIDVWSIDMYLDRVLPNMLRDLGETTHSYPYDYEEGKWEEELKVVADKLYCASNWEDWYNPYKEDFYKGIEPFNYLKYKNVDADFKPDEDSQKLTENYFNQEKQNYDKAIKMRNEALDWIKIHYDDLWD